MSKKKFYVYELQEESRYVVFRAAVWAETEEEAEDVANTSVGVTWETAWEGDIDAGDTEARLVKEADLPEYLGDYVNELIEKRDR